MSVKSVLYDVVYDVINVVSKMGGVVNKECL